MRVAIIYNEPKETEPAAHWLFSSYVAEAGPSDPATAALAVAGARIFNSGLKLAGGAEIRCACAPLAIASTAALIAKLRTRMPSF